MRKLSVKFNLLCFFMPQNLMDFGLQTSLNVMCLLGHMPTHLFQSLQIFMRGLHAFLQPTRERFQRAFYL